MTTQERWLVVGLALLILFGSAVEWRRNRLAVGIAVPVRVAPVLPSDSTAVSVETDPAALPLDVNVCDPEELETLPGIGPVKARRIVEWRETRGPFRRIEDLLEVRGIGRKTLERFAPYVWIDTSLAERR